MQEIPNQLATGLFSNKIIYNSFVTQMKENKVICENGKEYVSDHIVFATDQMNLPKPFAQTPKNYRFVHDFFIIDKLPFKKPMITPG
ncbi:hypothetical protein I5M32_01355 [Pedobacter sp. SD-b]|uniref:Uncharacterized protein n=1 Tax=Pedobacter segetis TaxID=2793069 RepID=A0ABS1BHB0_9SPHI|nr:hypothetical protein [Pedobacter segetis]MBK0381594.1 hypothetical protein [Pedobacter segetis]